MEVLNTLYNIVRLIFSAEHGGVAQRPSQAVSYTYIGLYWPYYALAGFVFHTVQRKYRLSVTSRSSRSSTVKSGS